MTILQPEDERVLIIEGLLRLDSPQGTQRIHKRRLNAYSDREYSHFSLSAPKSNMFSTIPIALVSLETIKYLGYNEDSATEIWNKWTTWTQRYPVPEYDQAFDRYNQASDRPFIKFVVGCLSKGRHLDTREDDIRQWRDFMNFCGINPETQAAILNPTYHNVRSGKSCLIWVQDTIELKYWSLKAIRTASQERAEAIQRAAS
jgi:hypothetical protein